MQWLGIYTWQDVGAKDKYVERRGVAVGWQMNSIMMNSSRHKSKINQWDDALLYRVAVDPFQQAALSGKEDGKAAGLRDGYLEGVTIGRSKGWEVGLELGYIYEFSRGILEIESTKKSASFQDEVHQNNSPQIDIPVLQSHRWERCVQLANDLTSMIDEFPDPDALLGGGCNEKNSRTERMTEEADECQGHLKQSIEKLVDDGACNTRYAHHSEKCAMNKDKIREAESLDSRKNRISIDPNSASMLDISALLDTIRARFKLLCTLLKTKQAFDLKNVLEVGIISGTGATQHVHRIKGMQDGIDLIDKHVESNSGGSLHDSSAAADKSALDSDW